MTMAYRAGSSAVEHWSAVRRVPDSIPDKFILCTVRVVLPNVTHGVVSRILPRRNLKFDMKFEENSREVETGEATK